MKKKAFIVLFFVTHIGFFFLHIHKHMQFIKESFTKQKHEQELAKASQQKQARLNDLYALQNKQDVKTYAAQTLAFKPVKITQLHRLAHE